MPDAFRRLSLPAKVLVAASVVGAAGFALFAFVADLASDDPSSTAGLIFPFMALYVAIATAVIVGVDSAIRRWLRSRRDEGRGENGFPP